MPILNEKLDRRIFISGALATASSYKRILGANDRIRVGAIGTGQRCQYLLTLLNKVGFNDIVLICDVYEPHRLAAKAKSGTPDAKDCVDFREVLDRKDIDAVVIGTPDHWHVPITIAAVQAGKDVYCEKPVTHKIEEGAPLIAAVKASKQVVQTGTQQRSWDHYLKAKEIVASGQLGEITFIRTYWYQNHIAHQTDVAIDTTKLDWKRFLGPATDRPFNADQYAHWRWYWDFGGGAMTDLFIHWVDVAHWFMGADMPTRATASGFTALLKERQTPDTMSAALLYPNFLVEFDCALLGYIEGGGLMFRGTKASMRLHRRGFVVYQEYPKYNEGYESENVLQQVKSEHDGALDHMKNFMECMKSRGTPNAPIEVGVAAARAGHIANFALRGSGVWNPDGGSV
jgi:predicted dehydrogenase